MNFDENILFEKALNSEFLSVDEGLFLYKNASTASLMYIGHELRKKKIPGNKVTWMIDRNVNITNVCVSGCLFCNFHCSPKSKKAYTTSIYQYIDKIEEMKKLGGNQLLLQGGMNPDLDLEYYKNLFKDLKKRFSNLKLHALGPPEIVFLSETSGKTYQQVLEELCEAGLASLPGAGAEILSDRVRKIISPKKCGAHQWLEVMKEAHNLRLLTSATMMFGHLETLKERVEHLVLIRDTQNKKPEDAIGFIAFIPWPFQHKGTALNKKFGIQNAVTSEEYIRTIAISRIMLPNINNIQASWLTVGKETAQVCLHSGANDFGSIMIEENVVSGAGASNSFNADEIQKAITDAGFTPQLRNQKYENISMPF
ncbi:MAG TPA: cyclic dehypoxanthinyl futalosine synthase [Bacteroidales bacterium]|nr:cyclic dehypoxanthinyl futalosine synthase [Bacteroidales bacterium]HPS16152.1 cyclic dehypoxanthinyl futalosine synthase [Bacteroidales bacterium]